MSQNGRTLVANSSITTVSAISYVRSRPESTASIHLAPFLILRLPAYELLMFKLDGFVQKYDSFLLGSLVLYASDAGDCPISAISCPHTKVNCCLHAA